MSRLFILTFFSLSLIQIELSAQLGFKGAAILGFNAAQMDGDDLAGYNKIGITGGLRVAYPLKEKMELGMEMLFSQRGSQSQLQLGSANNLLRTNLNYFVLPISFTLKDWYIEEDDYYRTSLHGGLAPGYLFSKSSNEAGLEPNLENFTNFDLSLFLGFSYHLNSHWAFTFRYTTGLFNIYTDPITSERELRSYFITFRTEYHF